MSQQTYYIDEHGIAHLLPDSSESVLWRRIMKHHMDACHAAGLDAIQAANLLLNGAGYLLGAYLSEDPVLRERCKELMVTVFRAKVDRAVEEGRADRRS